MINSRLLGIISLTFWIILVGPTAIGAEVEPKLVVLSSIKPLTLIAQEITKNSAETDTILPVTASPHDHPLKASDYLRLQKANIVLWNGPELESFLQKPISHLTPSSVITAYHLSGLYWPTNLATHTGHEHERDPHLWLDPRNAIVIAKYLAKTLAEIDGKNKLAYAQNLQEFVEKTAALDTKLFGQLQNVKEKGFVVYHEGYAHFVQRYGLAQLGYITFTPEQRPGAKHLHELKQMLSHKGTCIFLEPYYDQQLVNNVTADLGLKTGILDALGTQKIDTYHQLLEQMSQAFLNCLTDGGSKRDL